MRLIVLISWSLLLTIPAPASTGLSTSLDIPKNKNFKPFVGASTGYTDFKPEVGDTGTTGAVKAIGSYYTGLGYYDREAFVFDVGLGFQAQNKKNNVGSSDIEHTVLEAAARYNTPGGWQAGVLWNTYLANGQYYGAQEDFANFAGIQALKEFKVLGIFLARAGGHVSVGVNSKAEPSRSMMLDLHVTLIDPQEEVKSNYDVANYRPEDFSAKALLEASGYTMEEKREESPIQKEIANRVKSLPVIKRSDSYTNVKGKFANFDTNRHELNMTDEDRIRRMAETVARSPELFARVKVVGHTDIRGTEGINVPLSKRRAISVAEQMIAAGVPKSKIAIVGRSSREPVVQTHDPEEMRPNRRVDLEFVPPMDTERLQEIISQE